MLKIKNTATKMGKDAFHGLTDKLDLPKEKISVIEDVNRNFSN